MKEKKKIKIRLGMAIVIAIIIILIISVSAVYCFKLLNSNNIELNEEQKMQDNEKTEEKTQEDNSNKLENTYKNSYTYKHIKEGLEVKTLLPEGEIAKVEKIEEKDNKYIINAKVYNEIKISHKELEELVKAIEKSTVHNGNPPLTKQEHLLTLNNKPYKCKATGIDGEKEYSVCMETNEEGVYYHVYLESNNKDRFCIGMNVHGGQINMWDISTGKTDKRDIIIKVDNKINLVEYDTEYTEFMICDLSSIQEGNSINAIIDDNGEIIEIFMEYSI